MLTQGGIYANINGRSAERRFFSARSDWASAMKYSVTLGGKNAYKDNTCLHGVQES